MLELTKDSLDVGIVVRDLAASERFYRDVLGLRHVDDLTHVPGMVIRRYACGSSLVKLVAIDPPPAAPNPPGGATGGTGLRYLTVYVADVDHVVHRCLDAGADVPQLPRESRPGVVVAKVADPDGNWIEVITRRAPRAAAAPPEDDLDLGDDLAGLELCWGSVGRPSMVEYFEAAAAAGWRHVTVRPSFFRASVVAGEAPDRLAACARRLGLQVTTVDSLSSVLPGTPDAATVTGQKRGVLETTEDDCYRIADLFGARSIQVTNFLGTGTGTGGDAEMVDAFGALADRAARHGLGLLLEFIPHRSGIPDLAAAVDIVTAAGRANATVMVDTWHLTRSGGTVDDLRAVAPGLLGGLQVSDCPLPLAAMAATDFPAGGDYVPGRGRMLPGDGYLPVREVVAATAANNPPMLVGVEVFNAGLRGLPAANAAGLARRAITRALRRGAPPRG